MVNISSLPLDINSVNLDQQKEFGVTAANRDQILQAASVIKLGDAMSVHNFGRPIHDNDYLDGLLENVQLAEQGESGKELAKVVEMTERISNSLAPTKFQLALRRVPVVGGMLSRMTFMQKKVLTRWDSVKNQSEVLKTGIGNINLGYLMENEKLESMYQDVYQDIQIQGINIVAAQVAINSIKSELKARQEAYKKDKNNSLLAMEISNIEYQLSTLVKRRGDMITIQQKSYEDLIILRMTQQNNLTMIDKFRSIEEMTVPSAKRGHYVINALEKQKAGVELSEVIDNAANALAIRQAELVKDNSIKIARQSYRFTYDEETLLRISTLMNETISEVKEIHRKNANNHLLIEKRAAELQKERRSRLIEGMGK
ncbi:toxic anion resistance protein [Cronobacter turicensis]